MTAAVEDRLDATFAALANGTRRAILARLAEGEATVNQLAEPSSCPCPPSPNTSRCWRRRV